MTLNDSADIQALRETSRRGGTSDLAKVVPHPQAHGLRGLHARVRRQSLQAQRGRLQAVGSQRAARGRYADASVEETLETRRPGSIDPYLTPPYLDAEPDVLSTPLKHDDGEEMKFVILGSDGRKSDLESGSRPN